MANYSDVILGGVTLEIDSATPIKEQKTRKSIIGKTLTQTSIIGMGAQQWRIQLHGYVTGDTVADVGVQRGLVEALDNCLQHAYTDGMHDGTYYVIPGSLSFEDSGEQVGTHYTYTVNILEV